MEARFLHSVKKNPSLIATSALIVASTTFPTTGVTMTDNPEQDATPVTEELIEEVSIDGMCGVY